MGDYRLSWLFSDEVPSYDLASLLEEDSDEDNTSPIKLVIKIPLVDQS